MCSHTGNTFFWSVIQMLRLVRTDTPVWICFYKAFPARPKGCGQQMGRGKIQTYPDGPWCGLIGNWFSFLMVPFSGSAEALLMTSHGTPTSCSHDPGWWLSPAAGHSCWILECSSPDVFTRFMLHNAPLPSLSHQCVLPVRHSHWYLKWHPSPFLGDHFSLDSCLLYTVHMVT